MIRLVTRGDDAGSSLSANRAILDAFENGILRNTSVLATGPFLEDAAKLLSGVKGLCCGLHATVTAEWEQPRWGPVLPREEVEAMVEQDGTLPRTPQVLHDRKVPAEVIMAEVTAQLARLRELGFDVRYMDSHMGFTWLDGVEERMVELAKAEGLVYGPKVKRIAGAKGEFEKRDYASKILAGLKAAEPGTYLVIQHPTYDDEEMRAVHGVGQQPGEVGVDREQQRLVYMRDDVLEWCRDNVTPIRYDEI